MRFRDEGRPPVVLDVRVVRGSGGGPDKTILKTPRFLESAGYRNVCAYLRPPGDPGFEQLRRKADVYGAPLVEIDDRGPLDWRICPALLDLCRRERVAVWHGHDYKSNALGLLLRAFWPMRLVTTVHGWVHHTARTPFYYALDRLCLPRYEKVVCVSDDLVRACRGVGVRAERCLLVENGIDTDEFRRRRSREEARAAFGVPPGRLVVGAVGRLSPEKGFDVLLAGVDRLARGGLDVHLLLAGEGDERPRLEADVTRLGLGDRVTFAGFLLDPRPLYEALDVFALSSLREGLPNVVLEALAMEVPVVATRVAGVPRLIPDGDTGLLVEPGSADALADALGRLLTDAPLRARLAKAGRERVDVNYSFTGRTRAVATLYDSLLRQGGDRRNAHARRPVPAGAR
jgi:glycosyltransferase involved in cell wall biosynthesis